MRQVQTFFELAVGLFLFFAGLRIMTASLKKLAGSKMTVLLASWTGNRFKAFMCGLLFTGLTQSSSLTTVLVVSAADAGVLSLRAAIAVIIGANVGTTVTGQLLSAGLQSLAGPLTLAGVAASLLCPAGGLRRSGQALAGLGMLLYGLEVMSLALLPLGQSPLFSALLAVAAHHPLLGVLVGMLATALVQSSSAVIGVVLVLVQGGLLPLEAAVSVVIGADVGTCVTSLLAGLGAGATARRVALAHLLFNIFSAALVMSVFSLFVGLAALTADSAPRQLANAHTLYNLSGALLLLLFLAPFQRLIENMTWAEIPGEKRIFRFIGEHLVRWFH